MADLQSGELFHGLSPNQSRELLQIAIEKDYVGGAKIFQEGDPGDGLYVIREGLVEIVHQAGGAVSNVFSRLEPGAAFGEMAVIEDLPRSATAIAATDTRLYFIPREEMRRLLQQTPGLAFSFLQEISRRLRDSNQMHLREIVQAERLAVVGRFAQTIVHDLKNPLSIIGLSAEIFDMPGISPEIRAKATSRIKKQVERINDLVGDILIYTQGAQKAAELKPAAYDAFLLELLADLRAEAELKSTRIELQGELPVVHVAFDPRRLSRVFFNLIHNATDVMLNGGKIFLRVHADQTEVVTELEDTGPGIAPEIADQLFQAFTTFGKAHGTGLGLSICKKIVEDHGGRIWTRSEPGRGAIFCFALPLAK